MRLFVVQTYDKEETTFMRQITVSHNAFKEIASLPVLPQARVINVIEKLCESSFTDYCVNITDQLFVIYTTGAGITRGILAYIKETSAFILGVFLRSGSGRPPESYIQQAVRHSDCIHHQSWDEIKKFLLSKSEISDAYDIERLKGNLKNQLFAWRSSAGLTQRDIANFMGVSERHIYNIEINPLRVSIKTLYHYAHSCGIENPNIAL